MNNRNRVLLFLALSVPLPVPRAAACNVPVFRYALERWRADRDDDRYQAVVFHRGPLSAADRAAVASLRAFGEGWKALGNLNVEAVDLGGKVEAAMRELWQAQMRPVLPWLVVRYPGGDARRPPAWAGRLDAHAVRLLTDSPTRRDIARRLLRGDAVVWVLLEGGDRKRDDAAAALLEGELKRLGRTLKLPDPAGDNTVELLSRLPLRVAFSSVRARRDDPAERLFVHLLLHTSKELVTASAPVVFPVFGRGRVLDGLAGVDLNAANIEDAARFLCGACSCVVKRDNPGTDLLLAADWDSILDDRDPPGPAAPLTPRSRPDVTPVQSTANLSSPPPGMPRLPLVAATVAAGVLVVVTGVWALRSRPRDNGGPRP